MTSDPNCIFCGIVAGQRPAFIVHQDQHVVAFLDIGPLAPGHLLVVPTVHAANLADLPAEAGARLGERLPILCAALVAVTEAPGYNVLCNTGRTAGQLVPHVHFHLIPRMSDDGLGFRWNAGSYAPGRAEELARQYRQILQSFSS